VAINRESAFEILSRRTQAASANAPPAPASNKSAPRAPTPAETETGGIGTRLSEWLWGTKRRQGVVETMAKQAARTAGSKLGNQIMRGVLGGIFKSR
jgi:hypothetical protein